MNFSVSILVNHKTQRMQRNKYSAVICKDKKIANAGYLGNIDFLKAITCTKLSDFPLIMAIVLAKCTVLFILKVYAKIN